MGAIRFWGATVITNLLSTIPYIGEILVQWIWGGFSVDNATLNRFFSFHFILPFIIIGLIIVHLLYLHQFGSSNPIGINRDSDRVPFHPYFTIKDVLGFVVVISLFLIIVLFNPNFFTDPENYIKATSAITPVHIKPEWYFLWIYAILRSVPNKLGGVIAAFSGILIIYVIPFIFKSNKKSNSFKFREKLIFWLIIRSFIILTWIGGRPVEEPLSLLDKLQQFFIFLIL